MAEIETLVLDVGGVLLDWDPKYAYGSLISDPERQDHFLQVVCSLSWNNQMDEGVTFAEAISARKLEHPDYADLIEMWWTEWPNMCKGLFGEMFELIDKVRSNSPQVEIYGLTNFSAETWPILLNNFPEMGTIFDDVVVSGREKVTKPDREIYEILINRFSIQPEKALFVDDRSVNTDAAAELGFQVHTHKDAENLVPVLRSLELI